MKTVRFLTVVALTAFSLNLVTASVRAGCPFAALACNSATAAGPSKNIVETAVAAGTFKTLIAAAQAAGLADTLQGPGPFTVFAPSDEAFAKLPKSTVESLLKPENRDKLAAILKYHVLPGKVSLAKAIEAGRGKTVLGPSLTINFAEGRVHVGTATLVAADIAASNGTIHVIDSVLLPPASADSAASPVKAKELIELAIERGVPLFNANQPEACKAVYEVTAQALLGMPSSMLKAGARDTLDGALARIKSETSPRVQAWTLRHALDDVVEGLSAEAN
jgi:uncharacterized surface protein with fasciclin (FAS1) repeats